MKLILILILSISFLTAGENMNFDRYFTDSNLRIDYFHTGDAEQEFITIDQLYTYGTWAGSLHNLLDNFNNGRYYYKIYDAAGKKLIYSKGFDSYFGEYQTSGPAADGVMRTYHETALIPLPKNKIILSIEKRNREKQLIEIYSTEIDPADVSVIAEKIADQNVTVVKSHYSGDPHKKVDIVILGEGYAKSESEKFEKDLNRFTDIFFKQEPYKSQKSDFNIYGVLKPSEDSGVDEPRAGLYKNTVLNATFNSLGSERYLLTEDNKTMRDLAAHVPYDAIYIMVNHDRYGGGGIYNFFCTFTADNQFHQYLFIHEFGHSFAGLADEYYTSDVAYNDFYPKGIEPVEPNITALLNPDDLKWKHLADKDIAIPTPWEKEQYDNTDLEWQKMRRDMNNKIAALKKAKAPQEEISAAEMEYVKRDRERSQQVDDYLHKSNYTGKVGAFEGAGYTSKGLYRPMLDCIMFSKGDKPFCKVCEEAIRNVIAHYTK